MYHPYQCLDVHSRDSAELGGILVTASGPKISLISFSLFDKKEAGSIISSWTAETGNSSVDDQEDEDGEPPGKKRKIAPSHGPPPNIIRLVTAANNPRICFVAVTGEDKCVRVFNVDTHDEDKDPLHQLSQRCMQKRPCAAALDNQTILCGDKFGDVYGLPLYRDLEESWLADIKTHRSEPVPKRSSGPSATNLTVHSGRNRKALEHQLKQKEQQAKTKEPLKFPHTLLLGHVSMLTDMVTSDLPRPDINEHPRTYVFTSDRDEHIRISRGPPQTHIIEGFCLGHREFVSKLCVLRDNLLLSGGGDDCLFLWRWQDCRLLRKINLKQAVVNFMKTLTDNAFATDESIAEFKIAVSGLWSFPSPNADHGKPSHVLVGCESISAIFCYSVEAMEDLETDAQPETIALPGNVLAVAATENWMVVSVDNIHKPNSTTELRPEAESSLRLHGFRFTDETWTPYDELNKLLSAANAAQTAPWNEKTGRDLLYGIENLRKRGTEE